MTRSQRPDTAMILAAGLGTRMAHLTQERPKPLVEVAGTPLLGFSLDKVEKADVSKVVVNIHYKAEMIRDFLNARTATKTKGPEIVVSDETDKLLETGGGIRNALPLLGSEPFYVINSDIMWLDGVQSGFELLADRWCDDQMDALLLVAPTTKAVGYDGQGDFLMSPDGILTRRPERQMAPFIYAGIQLIHPRLFADSPEGAFSVNQIWNKALDQGRLFGVRREGTWFHVGTPEAVKATEAWLKK
jgi:N-acetyl-alpha-D-muramate 1-phosphate uridylyltransferase